MSELCLELPQSVPEIPPELSAITDIFRKIDRNRKISPQEYEFAHSLYEYQHYTGNHPLSLKKARPYRGLPSSFMASLITEFRKSIFIGKLNEYLNDFPDSFKAQYPNGFRFLYDQNNRQVLFLTSDSDAQWQAKFKLNFDEVITSLGLSTCDEEDAMRTLVSLKKVNGKPSLLIQDRWVDLQDTDFFQVILSQPVVSQAMSGINFGPDLVGSSFPNDIELSPIANGEVQETNAPIFPIEESEKLVLVHFWATWCGPCLEERIMLSQLPEEFKDKYIIVNISVDDPEEQSRLLSYLRKRSTEEILEFWDKDRILRQYFQIDTFPSSMIMSSNGEILRAVKGPLAPEDLEIR